MSDKQLAVIIGADFTGFNNALDTMQSSMDKFNGNITKGFKSVESNATSIFSSIGKIVSGIGVFKVIDAGINMITSSFDGAIARVDTLNQFPRVLEQMGYSANDAQASTDRLAEGIQGLPTTLDGIAGSTQRLVNIFGDVGEATESALALNNALLASGASGADASRGMEQYIQMLSAGKVDMQSWRTLQETMPYALNKTAEAFGFTGKSAQNDFYKALQDGDITMDDFNDKLIELSTETGGFAETALEASKGIQTSWANIKTAFVTGVANVITVFDDWLEAEGFGGIAGVLDIIKAQVADTFKAVAKAVPKALKTFVNLFNAIKGSTAFASLKDAISSVIEVGGELISNFFQSDAWTQIKELIGDLGQALLEIDFAKVASDIADFTTKWAPLIAGIIAGVAAFKLITGIIAIATAFGAVMTLLTSPIGLVVLAIGALVAIGVLLYQNWETITAYLSGLWDSIKAKAEEIFPGIGEFLTGVWEGIKLVIETVWDGIVAYLTAVWDLITSLAVIAFDSMKAQIENVMNLIKGIIETVMLMIQGDWSGAWETIKTTVGTYISATLENITTTFGSIYEVVKEKVTDVFNAVKEWFGKIPTWIEEKWGEVTTYLSSINLFSIGKNIILGLWDGLKEAWKGVEAWVIEKLDWLPGFAKDALGIQSPSRVFKEIGEFTMQGLAIGIDDDFSAVERAMDKINNKMVKTQIDLPETTVTAQSYTSAINPITAQYVFKDDERNDKTNQMIELLEELVEINHQLMRKNQALVVNGQAFAEVVTDDINYQNNIKDSFNKKIQGMKG